MYLILPTRTNATFTSLSFSQCSAGEKGGCVSIILDSESGIFVFENCISAFMSDSEGGFVYIECPDMGVLIQSGKMESFINEYANSYAEKLNWVKETKTDGMSASLLSFLLPISFVPY